MVSDGFDLDSDWACVGGTDDSSASDGESVPEPLFSLGNSGCETSGSAGLDDVDDAAVVFAAARRNEAV